MDEIGIRRRMIRMRVKEGRIEIRMGIRRRRIKLCVKKSKQAKTNVAIYSRGKITF